MAPEAALHTRQIGSLYIALESWPIGGKIKTKSALEHEILSRIAGRRALQSSR